MHPVIVSLLSHYRCHKDREQIFPSISVFCLYSVPAQDLAIVGT